MITLHSLNLQSFTNMIDDVLTIEDLEDESINQQDSYSSGYSQDSVTAQKLVAEFIRMNHTDEETETFFINRIMPIDKRSMIEIIAPHIFTYNT